MKTWAICVGLILGASWAFGGAGGRSITLDINQQDRAFSNTVARGEAFDWEIYLTRGGAAYTNETITGGGIYYSTSRTASAWVVFPFSSWSASGARVVCRMAATNSLGLSTNSADYPIAYDASIILTTANNVYRWRQGILTITDDGAVSGSGIAAATSTMVPNSRTITINGATYDLSANRSWTVSTTATLPAGTVAATNQGVAGQSLFWNAGSPTGVSTGYWATAAGSGDMLASVYDPGSVQLGVVFTNDQRVTLALTNGALYATAAQGIAATNAQARVAVVETNYAPRSWVAGFETAPVLWDADYLVPSVTMPDGTVGQMFEEIYVTIRNTSGSTITNGKAVRATSSSGYYSGATLASCMDTFDHVLGVIGLATMDITNGATGKITLLGNVNDLDTTAFTEGSNLWLSATAGELTMTKPTAAGCNQVLIGTCLRKNANAGRISVAVRIVPLPSNIGAVATSDTNGWTVTTHSTLLTSGGATINGDPITNGAAFTITGGGGSGGGISNISVAGVTGTLTGSGSNVVATVSLASLAGAGVVTQGVKIAASTNADWAAWAASSTNATTVTGVQSNIIAASLTNAASFATAAQGIAGTNAQARVAIVETNTVTKSMTNNWTVSSHASLLSTNGNGSGLTGITAAQVGAVSNNAAGIAAAGGVTGGVFSVGTVVSNVAGVLYIPTNGLGGGTGGGGISEATATNIARYVAFDSGVTPFTLASATNVAITRLVGTNAYVLTMATNVVLTITTNGWTGAEVGRFSLDVSAGAFTLAFDAAVMTNTTVLDISTTRVTPLYFRKAVGENVWRVRQ
jgi:hypothetical protein